jgi:hypothetical protein
MERHSMDFFTKYKTAALAQVAFGACVVMRARDRKTLVAIKIPRVKSDPHDALDGKSVVVALWSNGASPFTPSLMHLEDAEVLEIPGAGTHIANDPAHVNFGPPVSVGALYIFDGEPHIIVAGWDGEPARELISVRLTDGARDGMPNDRVPWFSFWTVAVPDAKGRTETICSIDVRSP